MHRTLLALVSFGFVMIMSGCQAASDTKPITPLSIWSSDASDADTPESAAENAVRALIGVTPVLGDYMAGDSRSGEVIVYSPQEMVSVERSLLLLRQLGPDDRWSVIGAINPSMTIEKPEQYSEQPVGLLRVSGSARGFEGLVIITAHRIADEIELVDQVTTQAGSLDRSEPFDVVLDLRETTPGDVIAIVVRGGVGLEDDPGEFSALAVRIDE